MQLRTQQEAEAYTCAQCASDDVRFRQQQQVVSRILQREKEGDARRAARQKRRREAQTRKQSRAAKRAGGGAMSESASASSSSDGYASSGDERAAKRRRVATATAAAASSTRRVRRPARPTKKRPVTTSSAPPNPVEFRAKVRGFLAKETTPLLGAAIEQALFDLTGGSAAATDAAIVNVDWASYKLKLRVIIQNFRDKANAQLAERVKSGASDSITFAPSKL
jgi:hypothetical protein